MVVEADRRTSLSTTVMAGGAISIATKIGDKIHTKASYAIYAASQIILHVTAGIIHRIGMVVTIHEVVNVAELTNKSASTSSVLD